MDSKVLGQIAHNFAKNLVVPLLLIVIFAMLILPLPPFLLDILFTFNISFALIILLVCINCQRPLDFGVFPSIILTATLLRLALNVASTRIVLLNGHTGSDAAGKVIEAFGGIVIGGNYTVGLVVFAILVIVNFVVVTKGANRVSEVSARFTLDALPGKQLAIDSDLHAGMIDAETAKLRREELSHEADFYGAMDGASKFVRGDAVACLCILFINIIGGVLIGCIQHDMSITKAVENYVLLTVGDGLVAQIPALLLSTATALIVTRVSSTQDFGKAIYQQIFQQPKSLFITGVVIAAIAAFPGMPHIVFMSFSVTLILSAYLIRTRFQTAQMLAATIEKPANPVPQPIKWDDVLPDRGIEVQLGYRLITSMLKEDRLLNHVQVLRKHLSQKLGFVIPAIQIRDNLKINAQAYQILINGELLATGEVFLNHQLAIDCVNAALPGKHCQDPIYGLPSTWIKNQHNQLASNLGCVVVDCEMLLRSHLQYMISNNSHTLFSYEEMSAVMQKVEKQSPKLYQEFKQLKLDRSVLLQVLQNLLCEHVAISPINQILEAVIKESKITQHADGLTERVRYALRNIIMQNLSSDSKQVSIVRFDHELEQLLLNQLEQSKNDDLGMDTEMKHKLNELLEPLAKHCAQHASNTLLVPTKIRLALSRFIRETISSCHVISQNEVPSDYRLTAVSIVGCTLKPMNSAYYIDKPNQNV